MTSQQKWRIAYLGENPKDHKELVSRFEQAYVNANQPERMALFTHVDSLGMIMAVSITPESIPYCPFAETWPEHDDPLSFGHTGWEAGDRKLKTN